MSEVTGVWLTFLLVLARVLSFLMAAPIFGRRNTPPLVKVFLGVVLCYACVAVATKPFQGSTTEFVYALLVETAGGLAAGILCTWLFQSFQMGGQLMDQQSGFAMATLIDPGTSTQTSLFSNLLMHISILLFLELNGHHLLIMGIIRSFAIVGPGEGIIGRGLTEVVMRTMVSALMLCIRLAIPVLAVLIITDLTLGMVGRTVPQLNVLMLGLPVKAAVALLVLAAVTPVFVGVGNSMLSELEQTLGAALRMMSP
jgi:flagellar biosynthetic protein FliR